MKNFESLWVQKILVYFNVLTNNITTSTEENHKTLQPE